LIYLVTLYINTVTSLVLQSFLNMLWLNGVQKNDRHLTLYRVLDNLLLLDTASVLIMHNVRANPLYSTYPLLMHLDATLQLKLSFLMQHLIILLNGLLNTLQRFLPLHHVQSLSSFHSVD